MVERRWKPAAGDGDIGSLYLGSDPFLCQVCGSERFFRSKVQLHQRLTSMIVNVPDEAVECFECGGCGYLHWFSPADRD